MQPRPPGHESSYQAAPLGPAAPARHVCAPPPAQWRLRRESSVANTALDFNPESSYSAEAFYVADATLGGWRRTVSQFSLNAASQLADGSLGTSGEPRGTVAAPSDVRDEKTWSRAVTPSSDGRDTETESGLSDSDDGLSSNVSQAAQVKMSWSLGMRHWSPPLYSWVASRVGTRAKAMLILSCAVFEALRFLLAMDDRAHVEGVSILSVLVVSNFVSLCISLSLSFILEGETIVGHIMVCSAHLKFMGVSILFTFASALLLLAYRIGTPAAEVVTFGYLYLPVSVVLSYYVFRRRYGRLEWLSVGMMTLAILTFVLLREESKHHVVGRFGRRGFCLVVGAMCISVLASIWAERIFKERTVLRSSAHGPQPNRFYVMKMHMDYSSLVVSCALWCMPPPVASLFGDFFEQWSQSSKWFGSWGYFQVLMVFVSVGQGWAAGLVTREFSTVIKAIVQTSSVILVMLLSDPLMGNRFHFIRREFPSIMLFAIILMSAMIFQTGRINLWVIRKAMNLDVGRLAAPESDREPPHREAWASPGASESTAATDAVSGVLTSPLSPEAGAGSSEAGTSWSRLLATYALVIVYIVSDAGRTIVIQRSLSTAVINSTSMTLAICVCGLLVASCLTLATNGCSGLMRAWDPRGILHCLPAAFLFALSTTFGNMAFALGVSPSLYVVLGKFYTPVAAVGARWVMGKFYMWLEWFALLILTLASCCFGYLKEFDIATGDPNPGSLTGMALVLCSAGTSALASLVTEKILKVDNAPFHLKKVRLDAGSALSSLALIPIIGMIATRPQDIPWVQRPADYLECPASSPCWQLHGEGGFETCANPACRCSCSEGVFAGWNQWLLALALVVNTAQGWLVGRVTQRFSTVHRAIADSFSLLAIYFVGDPLFNGASLDSVSLNLVAFIVPLSTATFALATGEMQKVMSAQAKLEDRRAGQLLEAGPGGRDPAPSAGPSDSDSEAGFSERSASAAW